MEREERSSSKKPLGWRSGLVALAALSILAFALGFGPLASGESQGHSVLWAAPPATSDEVLRSAARIIQRRLEASGVRGSQVTAMDDRIRVVVPGPRRVLAGVLEGITRPFRLEMRELVDDFMPQDGGYSQVALSTGGGSPEELVTYQDSNHDGRFSEGVDPKLRLGPVRISGDAIASAQAARVNPSDALPNAAGWQVFFTLTPEGSANFAELTAGLIGKQLAIVLDGVVLSAPTVQAPITGGQVVVTGVRGRDEARQLAAALGTGPVPIELSAGPIVAGRGAGKGWWNPGTIGGVAGLTLAGLLALYRVRWRTGETGH